MPLHCRKYDNYNDDCYFSVPKPIFVLLRMLETSRLHGLHIIKPTTSKYWKCFFGYKWHRFLPRNAILASYMLSLCVCLSEVCVLQRWLNLASQKQCHMIDQGLQFSGAKNLGEIPTESPQRGAKQRWGRLQLRFSANRLLYLRSGAR